jgi:AraC-like DNA-binding protein
MSIGISRRQNNAQVWHFPQLDHATLLQADYTTQHFSPHYHDEYSVGVITRGKLITRIGKHDAVLTPGNLVLINPGETHIGHADADVGCAYSMFYLPVSVVRKVAPQPLKALPAFSHCVIGDSELAKKLVMLHQALTLTPQPTMEHEEALFVALNSLIERCMNTGGHVVHSAKPECRWIAHAQAYLEAHCHEHVSLDVLAHLVHLSKWHFLRVFKATTGLSPHAFQLQMRVDKAKLRLLAGEPASHIALDLGFHDQTHFTKHFRHLAGVTPERFRQNRNFLPNNLRRSN